MTDLRLRLPAADGTLTRYRLSGAEAIDPPPGPPRSRVAIAAAHVVADPLAPADPAVETSIDWDATLAWRRHLWGCGLGVAEAMDTAQRGMGLDWPDSLTLIERAVAEADAVGGEIVCGAGTDHLAPDTTADLDGVIAAYAEQFEAVEAAGGRIVMMASRALARCATTPDDYARVYGELLRQAREPVILHWLGEPFDPALAGYWGSSDLATAADVLVGVITDNADAVDGVKVSVLDAEVEIDIRRRLPRGVRCYTGDDYNFPDLIAGDEHGHSDALLGIFDAIAPVAASALAALDAGDDDRYRDLLDPTMALSRHVFAAPTYHYKTGLVFLAWLNGHQHHFRMIGGQESARSVVHLAKLLVLADRARLLRDPELAAARMRTLLALSGIQP
ncbi:MAG TPA: dihydrodipicolinate synthase family protein [Euzebyales bacterium]|nr:dihydrodipicolinate synthase family protein [Euzebyales bacterium]